MENQTNITQTIINTINSIFEMLFSSIYNNLYSVLDKITFINSDILTDKNFENIFGINCKFFVIRFYFILWFQIFNVTYHLPAC